MAPEIIIYIKPGCPFCAAAEDLFTLKGFEYRTINYFNLPSDEVAKLDEKTNNWPSAPMIFINGKFYGGFDDIKKLDDEGKLDRILKGEDDE